MNKKIYLTLILGIFLLSLTSSLSELPPVKQGECIELFQYCPTCTYVNWTGLIYPDNSINISVNEPMTKTNTNYNYTFCNTEQLGEYHYFVTGDKNSQIQQEEIIFNVTPSGIGNNLGFYIIWILLSIGIIIIGYYAQDNWVVVLGSFALVLFGLYVLFYGINGIKDTVYTWGIGLITLMLGAYFGIRGAVEGLE